MCPDELEHLNLGINVENLNVQYENEKMNTYVLLSQSPGVKHVINKLQ